MVPEALWGRRAESGIGGCRDWQARFDFSMYLFSVPSDGVWMVTSSLEEVCAWKRWRFQRSLSQRLLGSASTLGWFCVRLLAGLTILLLSESCLKAPFVTCREHLWGSCVWLKLVYYASLEERKVFSCHWGRGRAVDQFHRRRFVLLIWCVYPRDWGIHYTGLTRLG